MPALPTDAEMVAYRADLADYLADGVTLAGVAELARKEVVRDLEDKRGIRWVQVYDTDGDDYITGYDGQDRNADRIKDMIVLKATEMVLRGYATRTEAAAWWEISDWFAVKYKDRIEDARLDVDTDDDAAIDEDEDFSTPTAIMRR